MHDRARARARRARSAPLGPGPGGPLPSDLVLAAREEESIDRTVARRLITLHDLGEALAWARDIGEAADELWVDVPTLEARLRSLHPSERAHLRQRLEHHEH